MSDLVSFAEINDHLPECPICTEHFDESTRIPRRMPCCVQSLCQPCLEICSRGTTVLDCPMCRHRPYLTGGVKSLPKETVILKFLDYLKIMKGLHLPCSDCPDKEMAVAQCDNCGTFLCSICLDAHKRNMVTKAHTINTFHEMRGRPVHQCSHHQHPLQFYCNTCDKVVCVSCSLIDHKEGKGHNVVSVDEAHKEKMKSTDEVLVKVEEKTKRLSEMESDLNKNIKNIELSKSVSKDVINKVFDNLIDALKQRRKILLSDVEEKSAKTLKLTKQALDETRILLRNAKSSIENARKMSSTSDRIGYLQVLGSHVASLNSMLKEESSKNIPFENTGSYFVQANVKHLQDTIKVAGMVRSVTFSPTETSHGVEDSAAYTAIIVEPAELPPVIEMDRKMSDKEITCPTLEWDTDTAKCIIDVSECVITNTRPAVNSPNTGCRIRNARSCLASRPLVVRNSPGQRCMYGIKLGLSIKTLVGSNKLIQEIALTSSPEDAVRPQHIGQSVYVATCSTHNQQLCLRVNYNKKLLNHIPLTEKRVGQSYDLQLYFLLDGASDKILVVNAIDNSVYTTVTDVEFDRPLWVMMYVCDPTKAVVRGELISGHKIQGTFANFNL